MAYHRLFHQIYRYIDTKHAHCDSEDKKWVIL